MWVCTGCRGRRAPNPPPQPQGSSWRLQPASNRGPQPPSRRRCRSPTGASGLGAPPQAPAGCLWLLRTLLQPLLQPALPPLPLAAWGLQAPTSPAPERPCTAAAPSPLAQLPLCSPCPKCERSLLTQAGRQRLLVGPHGPLYLPHGGRSVPTRLGLFRPRGPRALPASGPAQVPQVPAPPRPPLAPPQPGSLGDRPAAGGVPGALLPTPSMGPQVFLPCRPSQPGLCGLLQGKRGFRPGPCTSWGASLEALGQCRCSGLGPTGNPGLTWRGGRVSVGSFWENPECSSAGPCPLSPPSLDPLLGSRSKGSEALPLFPTAGLGQWRRMELT